MDVYVHPSYREGFGMVLQEAAAMECAIVNHQDIPGASEVRRREFPACWQNPETPKAYKTR